MVNSEMIPTARTSLTFFEKLLELQQKLFVHNPNTGETRSHMYASYPLEWPLMDKGIAYWIDRTSNVNIFYCYKILPYTIVYIETKSHKARMSKQMVSTSNAPYIEPPICIFFKHACPHLSSMQCATQCLSDGDKLDGFRFLYNQFCMSCPI